MNNTDTSWRATLKETPPNEMEKYSLYSDFTTIQKRGFVEIIRLVDKCIEHMQNNGELTGYVKINARIKSASSALKNDDEMNKTLDDVFGIEIIAGTREALKKIIETLYKYMNVSKERVHNKKNGYSAIHKTMDIKKEIWEKINRFGISYDEFPMIEFQFKTFDVKEKSISGPATHWQYKGETKEEIQKMYDNNEFNEYNLPIMYTVENHKIRILNKQETIKELYPFVKVRNIDKEIEYR